MKKKLLACLLFLFPLFAFASHAHAETIKVVSIQRMHHLNLKIQIKPIKELT